MHIHRLTHCLVLFVVCTTSSYSQTASVTTDSLMALHYKSSSLYNNYDFKNAIDASAKLVEVSQKQQDDYYTSIGYASLGAIYLAMEDTINCFNYYNKSLDYALKTKRDTLIADVYNDLGKAYIETEGNITKALNYFEKSKTHNTHGGRSILGHLQPTINVAWAHLNNNNLDKALPYLISAKNIIDNNDPVDALTSLRLDILRGRYYLKNPTTVAQGIKILNAVATDAEDLHYVHLAAQSHAYLSRAYEKEGNFKEALNSQKKSTHFKLAHQKIISEQQLAKTNALFKLDQYQHDLEIAKTEQSFSKQVIKKSKGIYVFFIVISVILLIGLFTIFLLYRSRKKYLRKLELKNLELIKAKEEAERLSNLKTQFFSTVSHELRTPLYGVIGLSSILLEDERLSSHKEDLKSLKFSADYLLALINDVLTLNKADANGMKLEKTPFNLTKLVQGITRSFTFSLQQNNNKINVVIDDDIPKELLGDSIKLSQILMNLVGNAIKFNENGTVEIIIKLVGKKGTGIYEIQFFIKDNGIGIPEDKQKTIFEEFSQVENNNYNYQGTGLGLPIVKKLLSIFNSEIYLKSEIGNGSIFSFTIELEKANENSDTETQKLATQDYLSPSFENIHILIVDDNKINQKVTQKILESRNFKTSLVNDGLEAVAKMQEKRYSLVLMDIHMPKMGGVEATIAIRKFDKRTPIIALTAVEIEEARDKIIESGMNDIILKPYDVAQFLSTILRNLISTYKI